MAESLASSERIRKQQKDLIKLLQENGGRIVGNSTNDTLSSVIDDSFSFIDVNQESLTNSFTVLRGHGKEIKEQGGHVKKHVTRKKSVVAGEEMEKQITHYDYNLTS